MNKYVDSGGLWPRSVNCKNGSLLVGSGQFQKSNKKVDIIMFAELPKKAPAQLKGLHEEYWEALATFSKKEAKRCKKKGKAYRPVFSLCKDRSAN
jgi:hypothetical protein